MRSLLATLPVLLFFFMAHVSTAQVRLNVFGGYTFQDRFAVNGGYIGYSYQEGVLGAGGHFGGGLEFTVRKNTAVELYAQSQAAQGFLRASYVEFGPYDVNITYIMIGGMRYAPFSPLLHGYGGLSLGAGILGGDASATKFAFGAKLGVVLNVTEKIGIKLGGQMLSPVQGAGGGFYYGTGGVSTGVSTYSSIYQFGFTGGLSLAFGQGARPASPVATP